MANTAAHVSITLPADPVVINTEEDHIRRRSIIREFFLNTSAHALPGIARSKSIHNRVFWSISFVSFTGIMIYFIIKSILAYFDYPTQFNLDVVEEWPQYFPAFSLCNASPFWLDQFIGPFLNYSKVYNLNVSNDTTTWTTTTGIYIRNFIIDKLNRNESIESFSFPLSSMLYSCSFNSVPCTAADFIPFTSSSYGICYTFNAKLKSNRSGSVRYANQNGADGTLALGFYVYSYQYVPYIREGIGIISLVHDNTQAPLIETAGIQLATEKTHKLGYKKKTTFFLSAPYTSCTKQISPSMQAMLDSFDGADYEYSTTICLQLCRQTFVYDQCGCINPQVASARWIMNKKTNEVVEAVFCNRTNTCYLTAMDRLLSSTVLVDNYCSDCSAQCSITDFIIQISSLKSPADWQKNSIKAFVENSTIRYPDDWSTAWGTYVTTNYVSVNIVRETDIVENNTQSATTGLVDVLSNIGGQTGLWIGISFLSIMEIIEMLYRLIRYQCQQIRLTIQRK
ncbi:unnamed protein product [Adineta steineri]|uniref:Uncharacterized protein n=1 Tax=Adineta steineri TaxID=433720 RepID=A0A818ZQ94_9BILA|nr:unnamed protein product [Adineta steineri]CAF3770850.1 unnamed protein product [Adineta steineri]